MPEEFDEIDGIIAGHYRDSTRQDPDMLEALLDSSTPITQTEINEDNVSVDIKRSQEMLLDILVTSTGVYSKDIGNEQRQVQSYSTEDLAVLNQILNGNGSIQDVKAAQQALLNLQKTGKYRIFIGDDSMNFHVQISPEILNAVKGIDDVCNDPDNPKEFTKKAFDWCDDNLRYKKAGKGVGYRNSVEVLNDKAGVCGEQTHFYLAMLRVKGIECYYTHVDVDNHGDNVNHACAAVFFEGIRKETLVDLTYHTYDIKHRKYEILKDRGHFGDFERWRR